MKIQQLSLFLENKPGCLLEPCRLLADGGINIRALTLADTQQFGIPSARRDKAVLLFRSGDPGEAVARLQAAGINVVESVEIAGPEGRA